MPIETVLPQYHAYRANRSIKPPFALDDPKLGLRSLTEWRNYPITDYTYSFNSWALRGESYERFLGKPVNICLGDSFTLNLGGPIEHSWSSQLAKYFDVPTLNFGIDGAGNDVINLIHQQLINLFDVKNIFVMYSFFHRRYDSQSKSLIHAGCLDDNENFKYFEKNKIENAFFTFLPAWCWNNIEFDYLKKNYPNEFIFSKINKLVDRNFLEENKIFLTNQTLYNRFAGSQWPEYDNFINNAALDEKIYNEIFTELFEKILDIKNRDGYHLNYIGNKMVCDYFLSQINRTPK
jgi:hypothetical protein